MAETLKIGDVVNWQSHGGKAHGRIVRRITEPTDIKGHHVAASPDHPQFLVETAEGGQAAHKPAALTKAGRS